MKMTWYNMYFKLFSSCILVKGYNRSTICDTQKSRHFVIPNSLYEILIKSQHQNIIFEDLLNENRFEKAGIIKFVLYFVENDYGFFTSIPENFPKMDTRWDYPGTFSNCILDFDIESVYVQEKIIQKIVNLGCLHFQLRFFEPINLAKILDNIRIVSNNKDIKGIEIVLPYQEDYINILKEFNQITCITFYKSKTDELIYDRTLRCEINYSTKSDLSEKSCGIIDSKYFVGSISNITESLNYNSCLNRKISLDRRGFYKRCPSQKENYGHSNIADLNSIIDNADFLRLGKIRKDEIKVCGDCEYRHICSDCRVFLEDPNDIYSKPLKCGYDPYTNVWQDWSLNTLKKSAIAFYGL